MLFASIDIGSNAARLLLAEVYDANQGPAGASQISFVRVPLRLGEDVFHDGAISEPRIVNLVKTLRAFGLLLEVFTPTETSICATAAMREAANRDEILGRVALETGLSIKIIDGQEEARIVREANNLFERLENESLLYVDVGGGSTEISLLHDNEFVTSRSFNVGTIRMLQDAVEPAVWDDMLRWVAEAATPFENVVCVGSGGNINKLVKLYGDKTTSVISRKQLEDGYRKLSRMSLAERIGKLQMRPDRADVIVPAAKIFSNVMDAGQIPQTIAPKHGLVDGLIYELALKHQVVR